MRQSFPLCDAVFVPPLREHTICFAALPGCSVTTSQCQTSLTCEELHSALPDSGTFAAKALALLLQLLHLCSSDVERTLCARGICTATLNQLSCSAPAVATGLLTSLAVTFQKLRHTTGLEASSCVAGTLTWPISSTYSGGESSTSGHHSFSGHRPIRGWCCKMMCERPQVTFCWNDLGHLRRCNIFTKTEGGTCTFSLYLNVPKICSICL